MRIMHSYYLFLLFKILETIVDSIKTEKPVIFLVTKGIAD
jgi:hypothetical protein